MTPTSRNFSYFLPDQQQAEIAALKPSIDLLTEYIQRLDNVVYTLVKLEVDNTSLLIAGGNEGRVKVVGMKPGNRISKLVDSEYQGEDKVITIHYGTEYDDDNIRDTVSKDTAIKVASYLWDNGQFPSGLTWSRGDFSV